MIGSKPQENLEPILEETFDKNISEPCSALRTFSDWRQQTNTLVVKIQSQTEIVYDYIQFIANKYIV